MFLWCQVLPGISGLRWGQKQFSHYKCYHFSYNRTVWWCAGVVPGPSILNMVVDVCLQCFFSSMARERLGCVQGFPRCTRLDFSFLFFLGHIYWAGHCVNVIFMSFSLTSQVLLQGRRESTEAWAKSQTLELQHTERDSGVFSLSLKHDLFFFFLWTRGENKCDLFNICLSLVLRLFTEELASFNSDVMSPFFRKQVSKQAENPIFKQLKSTWDFLVPGMLLPRKASMRHKTSHFRFLFC